MTSGASKLKLCYDRWSVGQSVMVSSPHLGPKTRFLLLSDSCRFVDVGHLCMHTQYKGCCLAMAIKYLPLLPSNGHLLCLLGATVSVISVVCCFVHIVFGVPLSVLSLVHPDVLCRCSKQTIFSPHLRGGRWKSAALLRVPTQIGQTLLLLKRRPPFLKHINV
jgi:hypothetical protein